MSKRLLVPLLTAVLAFGSVSPAIAAPERDAGMRHVILNMSVAEKTDAAGGCLHAKPRVTLQLTQNGLAPTLRFPVGCTVVMTREARGATDPGHPPRIPSSNRIRAPDPTPGRS